MPRTPNLRTRGREHCSQIWGRANTAQENPGRDGAAARGCRQAAGGGPEVEWLGRMRRRRIDQRRCGGKGPSGVAEAEGQEELWRLMGSGSRRGGGGRSASVRRGGGNAPGGVTDPGSAVGRSSQVADGHQPEAAEARFSGGEVIPGCRWASTGGGGG